MMNEKYKNEYRIPSARAQWWDYGNCAAYFITICTAEQKPYFGDIVNGEMKMTMAGYIAQKKWNDIVNHAKNIDLGEFIVMPNHIHGIVMINYPVVVENAIVPAARQKQSPGRYRFRNPEKNTVSSIIGGYKSAVSRQCGKLDIDFAWQSRFHDRIIRNDEEYVRVAEYIVNNPLNWNNDKLWAASNATFCTAVL